VPLLLFALVLLVGLARAQGTAPQAAVPQDATMRPSADHGRVVRAYTLPPDQYEKARKFASARYKLYFIDAIWGIFVLVLLLRWKVAGTFRDLAEHCSKVRLLQAAVYSPLILGTMAVLGLPTSMYGHWLSKKNGISVQGWRSWFWDWTKEQLIGFIIGIILIWILYAVIRASERRWWFYFWLCSIPILLFVFFVSPWIIDPLFNNFEPLQPKQPELVAMIERVVRRGEMDIPPDRMYLMKASEKLNSLNAYVTGFGASKRVVVWDTTISKMDNPEIAFVFGHEMGHYVLGHIVKILMFYAVLLLILLYFGYRLIAGTIRRWGPTWRIQGIDDWASLPALLLVLSVLMFLTTPIQNAFGRYLEHQADVYGLEVTHGLVPDSQQNAARAFQILGEVGLSDPNPPRFITFWLYDHPPIPDRVSFSLQYDPWSKAGQPEFVK
jgi:Zn-dependent protease with chaperone function